MRIKNNKNEMGKMGASAIQIQTSTYISANKRKFETKNTRERIRDDFFGGYE